MEQRENVVFKCRETGKWVTVSNIGRMTQSELDSYKSTHSGKALTSDCDACSTAHLVVPEEYRLESNAPSD
jgi:hypothetical protein